MKRTGLAFKHWRQVRLPEPQFAPLSNVSAERNSLQCPEHWRSQAWCFPDLASEWGAEISQGVEGAAVKAQTKVQTRRSAGEA